MPTISGIGYQDPGSDYLGNAGLPTMRDYDLTHRMQAGSYRGFSELERQLADRIGEINSTVPFSQRQPEIQRAQQEFLAKRRQIQSRWDTLASNYPEFTRQRTLGAQLAQSRAAEQTTPYMPPAAAAPSAAPMSSTYSPAAQSWNPLPGTRAPVVPFSGSAVNAFDATPSNVESPVVARLRADERARQYAAEAPQRQQEMQAAIRAENERNDATYANEQARMPITRARAAQAAADAAVTAGVSRYAQRAAETPGGGIIKQAGGLFTNPDGTAMDSQGRTVYRRGPGIYAATPAVADIGEPDLGPNFGRAPGPPDNQGSFEAGQAPDQTLRDLQLSDQERQKRRALRQARAGFVAAGSRLVRGIPTPFYEEQPNPYSGAVDLFGTD
jgi:hypothetical protein